MVQDDPRERARRVRQEAMAELERADALYREALTATIRLSDTVEKCRRRLLQVRSERIERMVVADHGRYRQVAGVGRVTSSASPPG